MHEAAFQEMYPKEYNHCYGCGCLNEHGLHIKTYWSGEESVTLYLPKPYHKAFPGYVYGGIIASLIDCHSIGTASAAVARFLKHEEFVRFVTASLHVDYLRPTPLGVTLEIRGTVEEVKENKVIVNSLLFAEREICAKGRVVAARMPRKMLLLSAAEGDNVARR